MGKAVFLKVFDFEAVPLKKSVDIFESMDISLFFYEYVVEPSSKNFLGQMPTILVAALKLEKEMPWLKPTTRWDVLDSTGRGFQTAQVASRHQPVSFITESIHQHNEKSLLILVINIKPLRQRKK